jgi:hypothetical protein
MITFCDCDSPLSDSRGWCSNCGGRLGEDERDNEISNLRTRIADLEAERDSLKIEVERLLVSKYFTRCREGAVDHCSGCATWGDDGQGNVGGKPVHPPCSCGASWNWAKKMEAERDAAMSLLRKLIHEA